MDEKHFSSNFNYLNSTQIQAVEKNSSKEFEKWPHHNTWHTRHNYHPCRYMFHSDHSDKFLVVSKYRMQIQMIAPWNRFVELKEGYLIDQNPFGFSKTSKCMCIHRQSSLCYIRIAFHDVPCFLSLIHELTLIKFSRSSVVYWCLLYLFRCMILLFFVLSTFKGE